MFDAAVAHVRALRERGLNVIVAGWSDGSRERMSHVLAEHGLKSLEFVSSYHQARTARAGTLPLAVIALEQGFEAPGFAIIGEQDILGDRLVRRSKRKRRAQDVLAEASALTAGDLVVHIDHGVGRFVGLKTIEAAGAPHDCLEIHYAGGDRLFLPGREPRTSVALRLGDRRTRQTRRRGLAVAQGAPEEARARDGGRTHPRRRAAHDARRAAPHRPRRSVRRILRALSL